ncbi:MAG: molybdopterin-guanine dinucleotide biosynthesis protein B [Candidatus Bathyarchaeota archaeon]|nr:MAG: molybdopterin-guanine dinucleotide biosynthesis protein B [Candidatus Bathyarchaeota archaeon]
MLIVAVVGSKKSGKTTAVETLVNGLTNKGYKVATVKHIPETHFTIDAKGKDTWRHSRAGAQTVMSVAPKELALIKKVDTTKYSLKQIIAGCRNDAEIIILEGFKKLVGQNPQVPKVVAAKTTSEALGASEHYTSILSFVGPIQKEATKLKIPYVDVLKEPEKLVNLVDHEAAVLDRRRRKRKEYVRIEIDERVLSLNPFVQEIIRNTIVGMISTLKGAAFKEEKKISITIKSSSNGN